MVAPEYCIDRFTKFIAEEFERIESENLANDTSFTFTIKHAVRGTTAVWGRSKKTIVPSGFAGHYNAMLKALISGKMTLEGYTFESLKSGNRVVFKVTRCKPLTVSK